MWLSRCQARIRDHEIYQSEKLSLSELEMLSLEIFDFMSLSDLSSWLRSHVGQ
ncbi:MAG: DUF4351 domain-containing protein [Hormoscilla sp.]